MSVPDGFLACTSLVNGIERQRDFDELAGGVNGVVGHGLGTLDQDESGKIRTDQD